MTETMTYKNRAVARKDNVIWYGNNTKEYVVMLQLSGSKQEHGLSIATSVRCYLMRTDKRITNPAEKVAKQTVKPTLYDALELAAVWLEERGV